MIFLQKLRQKVNKIRKQLNLDLNRTAGETLLHLDSSDKLL